MAQPHNLTKPGILRRLIDARVPQTLAIYIPVAWIFTEIVTAATPYFGLPPWTPGLAMVILIAGIPVVAFLAWAFQLTPEGVRLEVVSIRGGLAIACALAVLLGVGTVLFQRLQVGSGMSPVSASPVGPDVAVVSSVAVVEFESPKGSLLGQTFSGEIHDRLARHADLYVVSAANENSPGAGAADDGLLMQRLQVDFLLKGQVEADGDAFRLKLQLINSELQTAWDEDFQFGADGSSQQGLQRRVARRVTELLETRVPTAEYCDPSSQIEALESYHAARLLLNRRGPRNLAEAERLLKHALELDPLYGKAFSALAITTLLQRKPGSEELASDLARKALDSCATLGAAYRIWVPPYEGISNNWINHELQWRDALAMEPNHLWMLDNYSNHLFRVGHIETAIVTSERAYRNNPREPRAMVTYAWDLAYLGAFDQAVQLAREAKKLGDESCNADMLVLSSAMRTGASVAEVETAYLDVPQRCKNAMLQGWEELSLETLARARKDPAKRRMVLDFVETGLEEDPNRAFLWGLTLSDPDLAHRALAHAESSGQYIHMPLMWEKDEGPAMFRKDDRFAEYVQRIGLVEFWREFGWPSGGQCVPFGESFVCE